MSYYFSRPQYQTSLETPQQVPDYFQQLPLQSGGLILTGRSNVGKSSLINALTGAHLAHVSNTPGKTRKINIFTTLLTEKGEQEKREIPLRIYDLPGHGHASVSKSMRKNWDLLMDEFFQNLPQQHIVINIQDARHPWTAIDEQLVSYLECLQIPFISIFNKMDKLKTQKERAAMANLRKALMKKLKMAKQVHFVSATLKQGIPELLQGIFTELSP